MGRSIHQGLVFRIPVFGVTVLFFLGQLEPKTSNGAGEEDDPSKDQHARRAHRLEQDDAGN